MPSIFGKAVTNWQANGAWVASTIPLNPKNRRRRIPHQMKPIPTAYQRYKARHIKTELCVQCSRKPKPGFLRCRVCLERARKRHMERHPLFCLECRKLIRPEERTDRSIHKKCVLKRIARMHRLTHRRAVLTYQERHRRLGLCYDYPRKAFKGELCRRHYGRVLERYYKRVS
jgi:hypothetical protein